MAEVDGCHFIKGNFMGGQVQDEVLRYFNYEKSKFFLEGEMGINLKSI